MSKKIKLRYTGNVPVVDGQTSFNTIEGLKVVSNGVVEFDNEDNAIQMCETKNWEMADAKPEAKTKTKIKEVEKEEDAEEDDENVSEEEKERIAQITASVHKMKQKPLVKFAEENKIEVPVFKKAPNKGKVNYKRLREMVVKFCIENTGE